MASVAPAMGDHVAHSLHDDTKVNGETYWQPQDLEHLQKADVLSVPNCHGSGTPQRRIRGKRKNDSLSSTLCAAIVKHQLGLSINCILLLTLTHLFFPRLRPRTIHFFTLSYLDEQTGLYNQGWADLKLVSLWVIIFTALRAATMDYILVPTAKCLGINKKKATVRFAEQAWLLIYYSVYWTAGMYLMYQTDYYFNLPAVWSNFPTRSMTCLFKWYYLTQFAFWLQQILVVNIEERRKDHWQMFTHHIITCALMFGSYGYYQTKVGNTILCLMDVVDLIFPAAKLLKYTGYQTMCDFMFVVFIAAWFLTRHVFYVLICWSLYVDVPQVMPYGCYNALTGEKTAADGGNSIMVNVMHAYKNTGDDVCFNSRIHYSFLSLLLALQALTLVWFGMICRVAYGVIMGKGADDSRSDDEGEEEEEDETIQDSAHNDAESQLQQQPLPPQEVEVEAEDMDFVRRASPSKRRGNSGASSRRSKGRSSGISIPGAASDHKELLGRIGCDKPS